MTSGGAALAGVAVALTGSRTLNATTDAAGNYSFANLPSGGSYTVKPSKANYTFTPAERPFAGLTTNATADFTAALNRHRIRGRVRTAGGTGIPGAAVTLSGSQTASTTSDSTGVYTFNDLPAGGNYTVAPAHSAYAFSPASQVFNNLTADVDFDFPGSLVNYTTRAASPRAARAGGRHRHALRLAVGDRDIRRERQRLVRGRGAGQLHGHALEANYTSPRRPRPTATWARTRRRTSAPRSTPQHHGSVTRRAAPPSRA